jgi:hypothetical protein
MKNIILTSLICLILFPCCTKKEDLTLEVLNNKIISRSDVNKKNVFNAIHSNNYLYDSITVSKIDIRITNNGTKKYVFFIGKVFDDTENYRPENICFNIFKENEDFKPNRLEGSSPHNLKDFYYRKDSNQSERILLKKELNEVYLKEKISLEKIDFQDNMSFVVIHPGESKFFSYYKTLPVYQDDYGSYYYYKFNPNEAFYFQISLKHHNETSEEYFTTNQRKEIEANGYTIFNGVLNSNKVPIEFVDINKK